MPGRTGDKGKREREREPMTRRDREEKGDNDRKGKRKENKNICGGYPDVLCQDELEKKMKEEKY